MKLEQIAKGAQISGIEPGKVVRVVSADPLGDNAVTVVYKADDGRLGERVLFRSNESELHIASVGRPWSFDADGADPDWLEAAHGRREIGWIALAGKFGLG